DGPAQGVAVTDEEVLPAVEVEVDECRPPADVLPANDGDARSRRLEAEERSPPAIEEAIQTMQLGLVVGHPQGRLSAAVVVPRIDSHAAIDSAVLGAGHSAGHAAFLEADLALGRAIKVEKLICSIIAHIEVRLAVAVEVDRKHSHPVAG